MNNCLIDTFKNKNRPPFWFIWAGWMVYDVLMIFEGLVRLISLNFFMPTWTFHFICWHSKKLLQLKNK